MSINPFKTAADKLESLNSFFLRIDFPDKSWFNCKNLRSNSSCLGALESLLKASSKSPSSFLDSDEDLFFVLFLFGIFHDELHNLESILISISFLYKHGEI